MDTYPITRLLTNQGPQDTLYLSCVAVGQPLRSGVMVVELKVGLPSGRNTSVWVSKEKLPTAFLYELVVQVRVRCPFIFAGQLDPLEPELVSMCIGTDVVPCHSLAYLALQPA